MDYKIPFKKHMTDKKKLFLKTLQQMLAKNEIQNKTTKTTKTTKSSKSKQYIRIDGRKRLVHIGKKGGRYYLKNKKKHYVPKETKLISGMKGGCSACFVGGGGGVIDLSGALTAAGLFMFSKMLSEKRVVKKKTKKISKAR